MNHLIDAINPSTTPQTEPIFGSSQVPNAGGGFSWAVDDWTQLDRFLINGTEGGSYYVTERKLSVDNAAATLRCIHSNGPRAVRRIVEISAAGRAPKNDEAIFALALAASYGDAATKALALEALTKVARTSTHLYSFVTAVQTFRGWGRSLRRAIGNWYGSRSIESLAYQVTKYRQRNGWSHRDVLRLSHAVPPTPEHAQLFRWAVGRDSDTSAFPPVMQSYMALQQAKTAGDAVRLIATNPDVTWEMVPSELLGSPDVWGALLPNMPSTALIRNLGRMTANGLLAPLSTALSTASDHLANGDLLRKERVHPISVLAALCIYASGRGAKGSLTWKPQSRITDALDAAFYLCFGNITATGKRHLLALDVSQSMTWDSARIKNIPGLYARNASAAMSLVTAAAEPNHHILGFSHQLTPLDISPSQRLDDVVRYIDSVPYGATDCALPMTWALENRVPVDVFVVYTDSDTNTNSIHPAEALRQYRREMGIPAKLVVNGMVAEPFTIADPNDRGMMDLAGFDTATPQLISDFVSQ